MRATTDEQRLAAYAEGREAARRAVELAPRAPLAHLFYGINTGRWGQTRGVLRSLFLLPEVREAIRQTLELDPTLPQAYALAGNVDYEVPGLFGGSLERAEAHFRKGLGLDPRFTALRVGLAKVLKQAGARGRGAARSSERCSTRPPRPTRPSGRRGTRRRPGRCWPRSVPDLMGSMTARRATLADAPVIARIYNQGIEDRLATFETEPRSTGQIEAQLAEKGDRYPTVVVEQDGEVLAFAGAGPYRTRQAYAGVAEHSVYTARHARGRGAGRAALDALIREYDARGFWKLVSRIFPENRASLALHERPGFRVVGVYRRHGRLEGEWRDCVIVERLLGAAAEG